MNEHEIRMIRKNSNYKCYRFQGGRLLVYLFDQFEATKIRTAPCTNGEPMEYQDIFKNCTHISKVINTKDAGMEYTILNINYQADESEYMNMPFSADPICHCGRKLDESKFDFAVHLLAGEMHGICQCKRVWQIDYAVKNEICSLDVLYALYVDGGDNSRNLVKRVTIEV